MATFPLIITRARNNKRNAELLAKLAREAGGNITQERTRRKRIHHVDAADNRTLRGIPAIGRGVAGVSPGTRPDAITDRET